MDTETCAAFRREIADARGRAELLSPACADHIRNCASCAAHAGLVAAMSSVDTRLQDAFPAAMPDWLAADEALRAARLITKKRNETGQFILFLSMAGAALALWTWMGIAGRGQALLAVQATVFIALPFVVLAAMGRKPKGGLS